jgi:hypothetical protein
MNTAVPGAPPLATQFSAARSSTEAIPWYLWASVLATGCISAGLYWDISWHLTIGRDTFWTPAHLLIQFGAVLAGSSAAFLIFATTFGRDAAGKESSVRVMGLLGPLGAFITAWGAAAMVISAPFDNWWHNAYGLDVKIISPPHQLLGFGIEGIGFGAAILIVGHINRAEGVLRRHLQWLLLALGGLIMTHSMMGRLEWTDRALMHTAVMYLALAIGPPFILESFARPSGQRWARSTVAAIYTGLFLLGEWVFPLFAAEPKLGPVYQRVTHMVPLGFPILILAPAFALDFLWPKLRKLEEPQGWSRWLRAPFAALTVVFAAPFVALNLLLTREKQTAWNKWLEATVAGIIFVVAFIVVQWPFGNFLMSPAARNWVFGTQIHPYMASPDWGSVRNVFWVPPFESTAFQFWRHAGWTVFAAIVCTRLGITFGNWMRKVQR